MVNTAEGKKLSVQEVLTQFRRREILDAASELAREVGFSHLTMEKVAEKAGVSKGTIYTYFKDKQELLRMLMREAAGDFLKELDTITSTDSGSVRERLLPVAELMDEFSREHKELFLYLHQPGEIGNEIHRAECSEGMKTFHIMLSAVSSILKDGIAKGELVKSDPDLMSFLFIGSLHNLLLSEVYLPEKEVKANANTLVDLYLEGLSR